MSGNHATGWYEGRRFIWLGTRKKWFTLYVQHANGTWGETYQIATPENLQKAMREAQAVMQETDQEKY
jgi:hypothetical protein